MTLEEQFGLTPEFLAKMEAQDKRLEEAREAMGLLEKGNGK